MHHFFFTIIFFFFSFNQAFCIPVKHALVIANGNYNPEKTGWQAISSINDIVLIKEAIIKQGFEEKNIFVLKDATYETIKIAFDSLNNVIGLGDVVYIHYSGHGVQLEDINGDESDFLDEALVPIDAAYDFTEILKDKYIIDDFLSQYIYRIRKKIGSNGHFLISLDSCHSGTSSRGTRKVRGGMPPLTNISKKTEVEINSLEVGVRDFIITKTKEKLGTFVLFAGASADESNYETIYNGIPVGSLSLAICKVFKNLSGENSYRQVFSKIRNEMAKTSPRQTPVIEGDLDVLFLGNLNKQSKDFFTLETGLNDSTYTLNEGAIGNIYLDDEFNVFRLADADYLNSKPLGTGKIIKSELFSSEIQLNSRINPSLKASQLCAIKSKSKYNNLKIRLFLDPIAYQNKINLDSLGKFKFVSIVKELLDSDFSISIDENNKLSLILTESNSTFMDMKPLFLTKDIYRDFGLIMRQAAQYKFLKNLKLSNSKVDSILINFVKADIDASNNILKIFDSQIDSTSRVFNDKDKVLIKLENKTNQNLYYNMVAFQPDGRILPVLPNGSENIKDYKIGPFKTIILDFMVINGFFPPCGVEMLKIFATQKPINLWPIINNQTNILTRGIEVNPLESIVKNVNNGLSSSNNLNGYSSELTYTIKGSKDSPCK